MAKMGAFKAPAGGFLVAREQPYLVKLISAVPGTTTGKGSHQVTANLACAEGKIDLFLLMDGNSLFKTQYVLAALAGKSVDDIPDATWEQIGDHFGDTETTEGCKRAAEFIISKAGRPFWINVIRSKNTSSGPNAGKEYNDVAIFPPTQPRAASDTEIRNYKEYVEAEEKEKVAAGDLPPL